VPPQPTLDLTANMREALELLPVSADVVVSVPHNALFSNGVLVAYAAVLLQVLYFYNRAVARAEAQRLTQALESRDLTARRAQTIQQELEAVRSRMHSIGAPPPEQGEEIRALVSEREALEGKLEALSQREEELRGSAARAAQLDQERLALEELLDEASRELGTKDDEIRKLEERLKGVARAAPPTSSKRARDQENLGRRLRTLYKNLEIDDRAIDDLVRLRDETMKLKAEESLKRLADDDDNALVRRKVGGLPPQLSIFELGFGGKGRIYYAKGKQRRFRVLTVGAKNSQKTDLEYLSRLSREDLG
jgi:peptidoglycan hydrolase CwlO-like protein